MVPIQQKRKVLSCTFCKVNEINRRKQEGDFILKDSTYYHVLMGKYTLHGILIEKDLYLLFN